MYTIDDLNKTLGDQIEALKNAKTDEEIQASVNKSEAIMGLGKVIVEGYKVKANVLRMVSPGASSMQLKNLIKSSGISPEITEFEDNSKDILSIE